MAGGVAAPARELLTLSVGTYANEVAARYWNCQTEQFVWDEAGAEIDLAHDCLFRPGLALDGRETYLPRAVMVDLNGIQVCRRLERRVSICFRCPQCLGFTLMSQLSRIAHHSQPKLCRFCSRSCKSQRWQVNMPCKATLIFGAHFYFWSAADLVPWLSPGQAWEGAVTTVSTEADCGTDTDDDILDWPSVLKWPTHSASLATVREYRHGDETAPFNRFPLGDTACTSRRLADELEDSLHFFLEECDRPQGCQMLTDIHDGFAGVGATLAERIRDDHGKLPLISFALVAPDGGPADPGLAQRVVNQGAGLTRLASVSSAVIPLAMVGWNGTVIDQLAEQRNANIARACSAASLGAVLDTVTLSYRLKVPEHTLADCCNSLTNTTLGIRGSIATAAASIPVFGPLMQPNAKDYSGPKLSEVLSDLADRSITTANVLESYSPDAPPPSEPPFASCSVRGMHDRARPPDSILADRRSVSEYDRCSSAREMLLRHFGRTGFARRYVVAEARGGLPEVPDIPLPAISLGGGALGCLAQDPIGVDSSIAVLKAQFEKNSALATRAFVDAGLAEDDFAELAETLHCL